MTKLRSRGLLPFQLITLPFITILCDVLKSKEYNSWKTADGAPENLLHRRLHTVISWMVSFETDSSEVLTIGCVLRDRRQRDLAGTRPQ